MDNRTKAINEKQYITDEDVKIIVTKCGYATDATTIEAYTMHPISDKMIGFGAEYFKLNVRVTTYDAQKYLCFFVKVVSKTNAAKTKMAKQMGAFEKELMFYEVIKRNIDIPGLKPWSALFVTYLQDVMVFKDLSSLQYVMRNRHKKFDEQHVLQALRTLARFHACTIIFEETKTKYLQRPYKVNEQYKDILGKGGFDESNPWFVQCRIGALEAIKAYSKYRLNTKHMEIIENRWNTVFNSALSLADASKEHCNVICHRDLWNNNILFHYKKLDANTTDPDDCVFVDFAEIRYMPPAGDVMQLLHCNLSPGFRKTNLNSFLNFYYNQLKVSLGNYNVDIEETITRDKFITSAKELNLWGLVTHACLGQTFWLNDDMMTNISRDSEQFETVMLNDKTTFIKDTIQSDSIYKKNAMEVFEEIIENYILN